MQSCRLSPLGYYRITRIEREKMAGVLSMAPAKMEERIAAMLAASIAGTGVGH
jgi:hypothetical protein